MKITDYPINNDPNPETEYVVCAYSGQNYKILAGNLNFFSPRNKMIPRISDFMNTDSSVFVPSIATLSVENNHPGIITGGATEFHNLQYVFLGGETIQGVIKTATPLSDFSVGLFEGNKGMWINVTVAGMLRGIINNSAASPTYTVTADTWYSFKISLNPSKTSVDFYLYDTSGALLWTVNKLGTPTNLGASSSIASASSIVDWMVVYNNTELTR